VCTGVIHHNPEPAHSLRKLAEALKPSGLMELFVYNAYHRIRLTAFQEAMRTIWDGSVYSTAQLLPLARKLATSLASYPSAAEFVRVARWTDAEVADSLFHPLEHGYTVARCEAMARSSGLRMLNFCVDLYSQSVGNFDWNLRLNDPDMQRVYERLPDIARWNVTNLLLGERSPRLWFYYERVDAPRVRKTEQEICAEFRQKVFRRVRVSASVYRLGPDRELAAEPVEGVYPGTPREPMAKRLYDELDEDKPVGEIISRLPLDSFTALNKLRVLVATSAFPCLRVRTDL